MDNIWCGLPKPMATRQVKAMQHRKRLGTRKGENWKKSVWLVFLHRPGGMKYPLGIMQ